MCLVPSGGRSERSRPGPGGAVPGAPARSALAGPAHGEVDNGRPGQLHRHGLARPWSLNARHSGRKLHPGQAVYSGGSRCYVKRALAELRRLMEKASLTTPPASGIKQC